MVGAYKLGWSGEVNEYLSNSFEECRTLWLKLRWGFGGEFGRDLVVFKDDGCLIGLPTLGL